MNSRKIVEASIEFKRPERIPYEIWIDMPFFRRERSTEDVEAVEALMATAPRDFARQWPAPVREWESVGVQRVDEWGVTWHDNYPVAHPLGDSWRLVDEYEFPNPYKEGRFDHIESWMEANEDKYLLGSVVPTLFERIRFLRGFENALKDPYKNPERFIFLRDRVMDFNVGIIAQWLQLGVDGIWFSDDWGSQETLLIKPGQWKEFYTPCYQQLFDLVHEAGAHVWMHSCGNIADIIPDLIEIGLDVLNPVQPRAMDIDEIAKKYSGKLCFFGGADTQVTIPKGTPQDIDEEVRHLISVFFGGLGGYIGGTSHTILPDAPLRNIRALYDAFDRYTRLQPRRSA